MAYIPSTTWKAGVAGGTLIRAVNLNYIEQGIVTVSQTVDTLQGAVNTVVSDNADLSAQLATLRDTINAGGGTGGIGGGGNGTITSINGYPGPLVVLTKTDVGLGNVDNTSDVNKPISTAVQAALDSKAPVTSSASVTKASLGLGNVDNTSDTNKPVSSAQQTALNLKANLSNPTFTGTVSGISKSMVGLSNADNTSDLTKFGNYGVLPKIYYNGSSWPSRAVPTGYSGPVEFNSELYSNVSSPASMLENDRWARKRVS